MTNILNWIYENSPCMHCRERAVELLATNKALTKSMLCECLVDADERIRQIAEKENLTGARRYLMRSLRLVLYYRAETQSRIELFLKVFDPL